MMNDASTGAYRAIVRQGRFGQTHGMATTSLVWHHIRYRFSMAVNVRMTQELSEELRSLARDTGRSQQDLIREAISEYVRNYPLRGFPPEVRHFLTPAMKSAPGAVKRPLLTLPDGMSSDDLMAHERGSVD